MILQKELQEFLLVSPLHFVVVLHHIRLVGSILWRSTLAEQRARNR
jgi:hypothetical protein